MTNELNYFSEEEVTEKLQEYLDANFNTRAKAARYFQVSPQYISAVLKGRKRPNKPMLEALGLEKKAVRQVYYEVSYREKDGDKEDV